MQKFSVKSPAPLLEFLFSACQGMKKNRIKQSLRHGSVSVNGKIVTSHLHPLRPGDEVRLLSKKTALVEKLKKSPELNILYEDNDLIAVDKPSGLLTMGTDTEKEKTLYYKLTAYQRAQSPDGRGRIFIVHRLDRDASGVLLFAKSETIKRLLQRSWGEAEKRYYAVVEGVPRRPNGEVRSYLVEDAFKRVYTAGAGTPGARLSVTRYRTLGTQKDYALLDVKIETGRKNQIRVHLADLGHPITGDLKYGAQTNPIRRLALHAHTLALAHPITGKELVFRSDLPQSFKRLIPA